MFCLSITVIWCCNCTVYFGTYFQIFISIIVVSSLSLTHVPGLTKNAMTVSERNVPCRPFTRMLDVPQSQFKPRSEETVSFTRCQTPDILARNRSVSRNVLAHDTWTCACNNFEMKISKWCCRMWHAVIYHFCIIFKLRRQRLFFTVTYLYR